MKGQVGRGVFREDPEGEPPVEGPAQDLSREAVGANRLKV
jgi:hypothetical protein